MPENIQPNVTQAVPFFMVTDMEASLKFYVEGLGFELKNQWVPRGKIEWCWLEIGTAALMLQEYLKESPNALGAGVKKGAGVSVWFQCNDALALYHEFIDKGVKAEEPFVGNGLWDVRVLDPDGYNLHFESRTDVPEETMYSDWISKQ